MVSGVILSCVIRSAFSSTGMGIQPGVPCGFQPSPQAIGRRPPLETHPQHFRRPIDEGHLRPPPGYGGLPPFRGPFPPPYRFHPGKSYPLPHRPPLAGGNREPPMPYPPPRFRPPYHDNGGENFYNSSTNTNDYSPEQFTKITVDSRFLRQFRSRTFIFIDLLGVHPGCELLS